MAPSTKKASIVPRKLLRLGLLLSVVVTGCGGRQGSGPAGSGSTSSGSGGSQAASGGSTASGGTSGSGGSGSSGSGGTSTSSGGVSSSGGEQGTGSGGSSASGGSTSTGGASAPGSGGSSSSGGSTSSGGSSGTGGTTGSGGSGSGSGGATIAAPPKLVTSSPSGYWQTGATWTEVTSGNADVTVNDASASQTWEGFGGAFNEMGWNYLSMLSAGDRDRAIKLLFDANDGARFAFGRIPIGASDYAMDRYTLNDTAEDYTMTNFSIERDRQKLIPYVKAALAVKPDIRLWASPWSPPAWMKDNNKPDGGNMKDDAKILQAHALYLAKFVQEYGKENIKVEAIHPQNEPGYATGYPSCLWTAALYTKFVRDYLGPTFANMNIGAQIFLGTMSNADSGKDGTIISTLTADSAAMKYIKGFGLQWNMINSVAGLTSKNLSILQTEHKCGNYPWATDGSFHMDKAPNDQAYGVESWGLIRDWIKAGVNSYSAWNMVLDTVGNGIDSGRLWPQNSLLNVDTSAKKLIITPAYYVFRHVSQYVVPGAKRVATSGGDALAFKNADGSIVTILYNSGGAKKAIVAVGGKKLQFDMPANGWATVYWK